MPRRRREDHPGALHHVTNRGIAKKAIFETGRDVRYFLSCLARQVRAGDLQVLSYAVLTTHFHLLVGSPRGHLSAALQRAQDAYARWFNRSRRRDGPLFRGRFSSRIVGDEDYFLAVVRYIDRNPVSAGLAARPEDYPHGSARHYGSRGGPAWLDREPIRAWLRRECDPTDLEGAYRKTFGGRLDPSRLEWTVERRRPAPTTPGPISLASPADRAWMDWKSRLADGVAPGETVVHPETVMFAVEAASRQQPGRTLSLRGRDYSLGEVVACASLRRFSGLRQEEIAKFLSLSVTAVRRRLQWHAEALDADPLYADTFRSLEQDLLQTDGTSA